MLGYDILLAPGIKQPGIGDYLCGHNVLKAHARAYHLYNNVYRNKQNGNLNFTFFNYSNF